MREKAGEISSKTNLNRQTNCFPRRVRLALRPTGKSPSAEYEVALWR